MVMGRTHACHGAAAGIGFCQGLELVGVPVTVGLALFAGGLGAGAAIAPDLDCKGATASRALGWVTGAASFGIRAASASIYQATKTPFDRRNEDGHRGITHTIPGALAMGAIFGGAVAIAGIFGTMAGTWAALAVIWLMLVWALRALPPVESRLADYVAATLLTAGAWWVLRTDYTGSVPLLIGGTIAFGCFVHSCGDGLTDYGSPLLFPFRIRRQRWYSCGMPSLLRFKAGKEVENRLIFPLSVALPLLLLIGFIPGAYPLLGRAISGLWHLVFG
jgi:membrane-bound metal-dependent hydrolase YbcI (DUF457 family)